MAGREQTLGMTGKTMMKNLKRARGEMTYAELARRLEAVGRPIPPLGLRRIEAGERRVDVDDLMALAVVLGVSPLTLLLPHGDASDTSDLGGKELQNVQLWRWAIGERPLDGKEPRRFQADSLPSWLEVRSWTEEDRAYFFPGGGGLGPGVGRIIGTDGNH